MTSRKRKILLSSVIVFFVAVLVAGVVAVRVVQSKWFESYVTRKLVAAGEQATGGKVEIGSFHFDWRHFQADGTDLVVHGDEPPGAPPFVRVPRIEVRIRLFTSIHHILDVAYLGIDQPEVNITVLANGQSNVPRPKPAATGNQPALQSIVDAAVGHFDLNNATIAFADAKHTLSLHADKFRAQLWFNALRQGYWGELSFQPLNVASGGKMPVNFTIALPVSIQSDRVSIQGATIATSRSNLHIDGSIENLRNPKISAHLTGQIALVDLKNGADLPLRLDAPGLPSVVEIAADGTVSSDSIKLTDLRLNMGQSELQALGTLKDLHGNGSLLFEARLAVDEAGRLIDSALRPEGTLRLNGNAKLDAANNYTVEGNLNASRLSVQQGARRTGDLNLTAAVRLDPHNIALNGLRASTAGGVLAGDASLQDFAHYQFHGRVQDMTLRAVASMAGLPPLPYAGTIAGPLEAEGNLKDSRSLTAQMRLSIAPGKDGIPVSGRLVAGYDAAAGDLRVENSYLVLPHSRLDVNGSAGRQLNLSVTTTDLRDLLAATSSDKTASDGTALVDLNGHTANFSGSVSGGLTSGHWAGHLRASGFSVEGRTFDSLLLDATASSDGAAIQNAELIRGTMDTQFSGQVGMTDWRIPPNASLGVRAAIRNGDLGDLLALAGQPAADSSGALTATVQIGGTVGNPLGSAAVSAANGMLRGEPFDRIQAEVNLTDQLIAVPSATVDRGSFHLMLATDFHHARDSFSTGQLHAHVQSNQIELAQIRALQRQRPGTAGAFEMNGDVTADIGQEDFGLIGVNGTVAARRLQFDGQNYGDLSIDARTSGSSVQYQAASTFAGSNIRVNGSTQLQRDYATSLDASVSNLPIERALDAARRTDVPVRGRLSGSAHFSGTKSDPTASVDLNLTDAVLYDEPVSRVRAKASYEAQKAVVQDLEIDAEGQHIALMAQFDHPRDSLQSGRVQFHVSGDGLDLARLRNVQMRRPGLGGMLRVSADGTAELQATGPRLAVQELKADVGLNGITSQGKNLGDANMKAETENNKVNIALTSNLAGATIQGRMSAQPGSDHFVDGQLSFNNLEWANLQDLLGQPTGGGSSFDAASDGQITVQGPAMKPYEWHGSMRLSRVEVSSTAGAKQPGGTKQAAARVALKNPEPISATLDMGTLRIDSARLTGSQTDIQAKGSVGLQDRSMNLTLNGNANLGVLQTLNRDITSSGTLALATTIRGTVVKPEINGTLQLQNASFNHTEFPNGISNANGTVDFNGATASLRNLTAQTGGGKVTLTGFVLMSDNPRFGIRLNASGVRSDVQQGVSLVANANLNLTGTRDASTVSGQATITRINYAPRTDLGSILTRAAPSVEGSAAPSALLDNMKLDVQVQTSDALAVQSSLAQTLEGNANLRVRGTASHPSVLGRVSLTGGALTFFGSSYTVNSGTISFYDPVRIVPVLDASLETNTEGVDVTLRVTGPIDNLKLSYTSDPPLQFEEIVGLLAAGKTPTSDPTLLANNPPPQQGISQMGESAVLSNALANPVANRLQRVFGVTQLKINPAFTNGSSTPDATLSLQQQIANNITFTYVTDVNNANAETIRVEVTLNPRWSAAAMRDEYGIFSINLLYRREFR